MFQVGDPDGECDTPTPTAYSKCVYNVISIIKSKINALLKEWSD